MGRDLEPGNPVLSSGPFPLSEYWQDIVSRYGKYESLCNLHCSTKPGEYVGGDPERTILLSSF